MNFEPKNHTLWKTHDALCKRARYLEKKMDRARFHRVMSAIDYGDGPAKTPISGRNLSDPVASLSMYV